MTTVPESDTTDYGEQLFTTTEINVLITSSSSVPTKMFKGDDSHFVKNYTSDENTMAVIAVTRPVSIAVITEPSTEILNEFTTENENEIGSTRSNVVFEDSTNNNDTNDENEITTNDVEHVTSDDDFQKINTVPNSITNNDNFFERTTQFSEPKTIIEVTTLYTGNSETIDFDDSAKNTLMTTTVSSRTSVTENAVNSHDQIIVVNPVRPESVIETSTFSPNNNWSSVTVIVPDDNTHDVSTFTESVTEPQEIKNIQTAKFPEDLVETTRSSAFSKLSSTTTAADDFQTSDTIDGLVKDTDMNTENVNRNSIKTTTLQNDMGNDATTLDNDNNNIRTTTSDNDNINASTDKSVLIIRNESTENPTETTDLKTSEIPKSSEPTSNDVRSSTTNVYQETTTGIISYSMDSRTIYSDEENEIKNNDVLVTTQSYLETNTADNGMNNGNNNNSTGGLSFKTSESNDVTLDFTNNIVTTTSNEFPPMPVTTTNSRDDASLQITSNEPTISSKHDNATTPFNDEGDETTTNANFNTITSINLYIDTGPDNENDDRVLTTKNSMKDFDVFTERATELFNVEKEFPRTSTNRVSSSTTDAEMRTDGTDGQLLDDGPSTVVSKTINDIGTEGPTTTRRTNGEFVTFNNEIDEKTTASNLSFKTSDTTTMPIESNDVMLDFTNNIVTTTSHEFPPMSITTTNSREDASLQVTSNELTISSKSDNPTTPFNDKGDETTTNANFNTITSINLYVDTRTDNENDDRVFTTGNPVNDVFTERTTELFNVEKEFPRTTTNRVSSSTMDAEMRTDGTDGQLLDDRTTTVVSKTINDIGTEGPTTTRRTNAGFEAFNDEIDEKTTASNLSFKTSDTTTMPIESNDVMLDFTNNIVTTTSHEFPPMSITTTNSREDASLQVTSNELTISSKSDNPTTPFNDKGDETTTNANFNTITSINLYVDTRTDNENDDRVFTTGNPVNDVFTERTTELFNVEKEFPRTTTNRVSSSTMDAEMRTDGTDGQLLDDRTTTVVSKTINDIGTEGPTTTRRTNAGFEAFNDEIDEKTTASNAVTSADRSTEENVRRVTTDNTGAETFITATAPDQATYDLVNRLIGSTEARDEDTTVEPETTIADSDVSRDVHEKWETSSDGADELSTVVGITTRDETTAATGRRPTGAIVANGIFTENHETTTDGFVTNVADNGVGFDDSTTSSGRGKNESVIMTSTRVADGDDTISAAAAAAAAANGETSTMAANEVIAGSGVVTENESIVSTRIHGDRTDEIETVDGGDRTATERRQSTKSPGTVDDSAFETTTVASGEDDRETTTVAVVVTMADWIKRTNTVPKVSSDEPVTGENVETRSDSPSSHVVSENGDDVHRFETSSITPPSADDATAVINLMTTSIEILVSRLGGADDDDSPPPTTSNPNEETTSANVTTTVRKPGTAERTAAATTAFAPAEETTFDRPTEDSIPATESKNGPTTPDAEQDTTDSNDNNYNNTLTTTEYTVTSKIVGIEDVTLIPENRDDQITDIDYSLLLLQNITAATRKRCWHDADCDAGHKCLAAKCLPTGESHVNNCPPGIITLQCLNKGIIYT